MEDLFDFVYYSVWLIFGKYCFQSIERYMKYYQLLLGDIDNNDGSCDLGSGKINWLVVMRSC